MIRDLQGNRIKKQLNECETRFMEQFYIYDKSIFQIVRIKTFSKLQDGTRVELKIRKVFTNKINKNGEKQKINLNKVKTIDMSKQSFEEKFFYKKIGKAINKVCIYE